MTGEDRPGRLLLRVLLWNFGSLAVPAGVLADTAALVVGLAASVVVGSALADAAPGVWL